MQAVTPSDHRAVDLSHRGAREAVLKNWGPHLNRRLQQHWGTPPHLVAGEDPGEDKKPRLPSYTKCETLKAGDPALTYSSAYCFSSLCAAFFFGQNLNLHWLFKQHPTQQPRSLRYILTLKLV